MAREITPPESEPQPNVEKPLSLSARPPRGALVPTPMPNRVYASRSGQIITVTPIGEPDRAVRKAGPVSAVDFSFDVVMNAGEPQRVRVAVATEVLADLEPWSAQPESLDVIGRGGTADELATDLCITRILEAIDKGIDLDGDFERFPDSFLVIRELPGPTSKIATIQMDEDIKDYISRRLYAARRACREVHQPERCAQLFERPDWFYLKVGQPDFLRVIRECMDQRWTKPFREEEYYLLWTDSLIQVMREAERDAATVGSPAQADQLAVAAPPRRGGDGNEPQPSTHPVREWLLGYKANRWLQKEEARRGRRPVGGRCGSACSPRACNTPTC